MLAEKNKLIQQQDVSQMLKKRLNHNRSMMNKMNMRNNALYVDKGQKPIKLHLVKKVSES